MWQSQPQLCWLLVIFVAINTAPFRDSGKRQWFTTKWVYFNVEYLCKKNTSSSLPYLIWTLVAYSFKGVTITTPVVDGCSWYSWLLVRCRLETGDRYSWLLVWSRLETGARLNEIHILSLQIPSAYRSFGSKLLCVIKKISCLYTARRLIWQSGFHSPALKKPFLQHQKCWNEVMMVFWGIPPIVKQDSTSYSPCDDVDFDACPQLVLSRVLTIISDIDTTVWWQVTQHHHSLTSHAFLFF